MVAERKPEWPTSEYAIASIIRARAFSLERFRLASIVAFGSLIVVLLAMLVAFVIIDRAPTYRYVLVANNGDIIRTVPLDRPNRDDEFLAKWTVDAVTRLWSFDYERYRQQFQRAREDITVYGFEVFEKALIDSGNFHGIIQGRQILTAAPTGPARITWRGDFLGRYAWRVEFPMQIVYRSVGGRPSTIAPQNVRVSAVVIRQPEHINQAGLGVRHMNLEE